jgi:glycosyltransferase involved in cell wall biosynthesis
MKSILVNIINLSKEGVQIIWLIKIMKLESLGCQITLNCGEFIKEVSLKDCDVYKFNEQFSELKALPQLTFNRFKYIAYAFARNVKAFAKLPQILSHRYDVIYTPTSVLEFLLLPFAIKLLSKKTKWVVVFDNTVRFWGPGNKVVRVLAWIFFNISLLLLRKADTIYAISPDLRSYLLGKGFSEGAVIVTGNAVESALIRRAEVDPQYNIDILFMGRLNEKKGIFDMLEVLDVVKKDYPQIQLGILGEGDSVTVAAFKNTIKARGMDNNVQFLGYKTGLEKFRILKSSKCFLFLSYEESFGVALLEAVCAGKFAFVYDLVPFRNIYQNEEVNIFKKGDFISIGQNMVKYFQKAEYLNIKGELLLDKYDWDNIAQLEYDAF